MISGGWMFVRDNGMNASFFRPSQAISPSHIRCSELNIDKRLSLSPVEGARGKDQKVKFGLGVALAAGAGAELYDLQRCEMLAREPRCRLEGGALAALKRSLIDRPHGAVS